MEKKIVGTKIGIYDVIEQLEEKSNDRHKLYRIKCEVCGWETAIQSRHICRLSQKCNHINSAGQYIANNKKINWQNSRIKNIYQGLIQRCYNQKDESYRWYGAKGIKVCEEWINNPASFESWALKNGYKDNLTIDRINSDKDYCPDNCRWVSMVDNSKYKSTTSLITVNDIAHTGREWATILNLGVNTINKMLRNYSQEQVIEFIKQRLANPNVCRKSKQTWFDAYKISS